MTTLTTPCPDWCQLAPDDHDVDFDGATVHYGPDFGMIEVSQGHSADGTSTEPLTGSTGDTLDGLDADDLRRLAADALRAAYWLECGTDNWSAAVTTALGEWMEAQA